VGTGTAIADTGETLVELLRDRMGGMITNTNEIALTSPNASRTEGVPRLTLFLYRTAVSSHLRNHAGRGGTTDNTRSAPLALDLHYLLTAHPSDSGSDETARSLEQHRVLGRAMQVLTDNTVLTGSDLRGSVGEDRELRIVLTDQDVTETLEVWSTFADVPFQPSVTFLVGPVFIQSERSHEVQRVVERRVEEYLASEEADGSG
jgi:hypothetical protein